MLEDADVAASYVSRRQSQLVWCTTAAVLQGIQQSCDKTDN